MHENISRKCVFQWHRKTNGLQKMEKKRGLDYTDFAYREAVSRLRYLMAESYHSPYRHYTAIYGEEQRDPESMLERTRSLLSPHRRPPYYSSLRRGLSFRSPPRVKVDSAAEDNNTTAPNTPRAAPMSEQQQTNPPGTNSLPPEMVFYIDKQEEYIDQLEKESQYCREELANLMGKMKEVMSENENLYDRQKSGIIKSLFDCIQSDREEEEDEEGDTEASEPTPRRKKVEKKSRMEGPNIVFESRISELEAQLTHLKIELKKSQEEAAIYKARLANEDFSDRPNIDLEHHQRQIENLRREKEELAETVQKLQKTLSDLRDRESDASHKLKRSKEAAEQAHFDKSQVQSDPVSDMSEMEVRRLKDELDRLHLKLREAIAEQGRRASEERSAVERRCQSQVEQLQAELSSQWDTTSRLQLEVEKLRRVDAELRRELANKNATLDDLAKETQSKIDVLQGELSSALMQHTSLSQELASAQLAAERADREGKQDSKRLGAEILALRERLERADAETLRARQEALRLSEQLAALDREIGIKMSLFRLNKSRVGFQMTLNKTKDIIAASPNPRDQDFSNMISNMETKHVETVSELEGMIQSQNQVMAKLKDECHNLTQRLEESSMRHKQEMVGLQSNINYLTEKLESSLGAQKDYEIPSYTSRASTEQPTPMVSNYDLSPAAVVQQLREDYEPSRVLSGSISGDSYSYQPTAAGGSGLTEALSGRVEDQLESSPAVYEQQYEEPPRRTSYEPQYEPPEPEQSAIQPEPPERPPNKTLSRGPSYETVHEAPRLVSSRPPSGGSSRTPSSPSARGRGVKQP
ncbi:serologically defined colon cancer antigen 8 homolog isoform X3 [Neocloeon triangulifer]|uniref:serologically defined colon cancer antigen 8 homolog isoform X3 n=1 Tax=Neocloeon triangulifer TaxID=2078957 RepID=UPI00286ED8DE|nr:serologically defined colon cancer antigen 8 homolog isoform X3 [Neocloeon triangulifer]